MAVVKKGLAGKNGSSLHDQGGDTSGNDSQGRDHGHGASKGGSSVLTAVARVISTGGLGVSRSRGGSGGSGGLVGGVTEGSKGGVLAHGVERGALGHVGHVQAQSLPCRDLIALAVSGSIGGGADLAVGHSGHLLADRVDGTGDDLARGETREGGLGLAVGDQRGGAAEDGVGLCAGSLGDGGVLLGRAEGGEDGEGSTIGRVEGLVGGTGDVERASGEVLIGRADLGNGAGDVGGGDGVVGAGGIGRVGQADRGSSITVVVALVGRDSGDKSGGDGEKQ